MTNPTTIRFNAAKLLQTDINAWRSCGNEQCREKQACTGGPRGTSRKTDGWPACTQEGRERLRETGTGRKWVRSKTYDGETRTERTVRRMSTRLFDIHLDAVIAGLAPPDLKLVKLLEP